MKMFENTRKIGMKMKGRRREVMMEEKERDDGEGKGGQAITTSYGCCSSLSFTKDLSPAVGAPPGDSHASPFLQKVLPWHTQRAPGVTHTLSTHLQGKESPLSPSGSGFSRTLRLQRPLGVEPGAASQQLRTARIQPETCLQKHLWVFCHC